MTPPFTPDRRQFLGTAAGAVALLGLTACGSSRARTGGGQTAATSGFRWTDGRGTTIDLKTVPTKVVAQSSAAAALWDAGFKVAGVYGELGRVDGKLNYQDGHLDPTGMTIVGKTYGEFNIEQYASIPPDLLVDLTFDKKSLWYVPADDAAAVAKLAPTLGVRMLDLELPQIIAEFMDLATKLGADTTATSITTAQRTYDSAIAAVKKAVAANPDLRVVAVSRDQDKAYFADAAVNPDLAQLRSLGVTFPKLATKAGVYFVETSWENIGQYPADVIIYDAREAPAAKAVAEKTPTWTRLPAVKAGQVYPWYPAAPYSYSIYGPIYQQVADWYAKARPLSQA